MRTKILLLVVDMQNDFCLPGGALYVDGAEEDVERVGKFITRHQDLIDHIIMTQDNHNVIDISHPVFWEDKNGDPPPPFTGISTRDVDQGIWLPRFEKEKVHEYIHKLERQGEFLHTIWPEHCIIGSSGAAITDEIMESIKAWARKGNFYELVIKGTNPLTEHFGALMANIPVEGSPETQLNTQLINTLNRFETILLAGEAKSHCVAYTVKQMLNIEGLAQKLVILEDCMSDVAGFETVALTIYENARLKGTRFTTSIEWTP